MNESFMRIICDVCGRITLTPVLMDCSALLYRQSNGQDGFLRLCPEHKAQWERMMSDFLSQKDSLELPSLAQRWNNEKHELSDDDLGRIAYTNYCRVVDWKSINGDDLPLWDAQRERIKNAWIASAKSARAV